MLKILAKRQSKKRPGYVDWRSELQAELALTRIPDLEIHKTSVGPSFLVANARGVCFFVTVQGFSAFHEGPVSPAKLPVLIWRLDAQTVRVARASSIPVLLFVFDADADHGRFIRLDTLPAPAANARSVTIAMPRKNTITKESLERAIAELTDANK